MCGREGLLPIDVPIVVLTEALAIVHMGVQMCLMCLLSHSRSRYNCHVHASEASPSASVTASATAATAMFPPIFRRRSRTLLLRFPCIPSNIRQVFRSTTPMVVTRPSSLVTLPPSPLFPMSAMGEPMASRGAVVACVGCAG